MLTNIEIIADLQSRLQQHADAGKKRWWESYMKGAIPFYGVPMNVIRQEVHNGIPAEGRVELALNLLRHPMAEEKLAGILILAEQVVPEGEVSADMLLPLLPPLFDAGHIQDWNTCDWFCVKFMHELLVREGQVLAEAIIAWRYGKTLWQRRAVLVSFVKLAPKGEQNWPGFVETVLNACEINIQDRERFAQTAIGWLLRELSKTAPEQVYTFVDRHSLSNEAKRMAMAKITKRGRH